jgi:translation initiation factor RLI1
VDQLENLNVRSLSGGESQRLAICICLGTPAFVYLIDEPSAGLDCEQRVIVSKVIKRWIVNHLGRTAFVIEHDVLMTTALADRIVVYAAQKRASGSGAQRGLRSERRKERAAAARQRSSSLCSLRSPQKS